MSKEPNLESILQSVKALENYDFKDPVQKRRATDITRAVSDKLQNPIDKIAEMWGGPSRDAALKVCVDVDLFSKWQAAGEIKSADELAELTGVQPVLMSALLKHLATWHILTEHGPALYSQTEYTLALTRPEVQACVNLQFELFFHAFPVLPTFLRAANYTRPTDPQWTPFCHAVSFHGDLFKYMAAHPAAGQALDLTMKGYSTWRGHWLEVYDSRELVEGAVEGQVVVVDVGGGVGHDLTRFHDLHWETSSGRLVLQDLPHVLDKADVPAGIAKQPHDFFTPQLVKGARAYFMHQILHDWADEPARRILEGVKGAMRRGRGRGSSRVLINEMVVPLTGASMHNTTLDFIMMGTNAARERDETAWVGLVESAGLKVVKIWRSEGAVDGVIECCLEE